MKLKTFVFLTVFSLIGFSVNAQDLIIPPPIKGDAVLPYVNVRIWAGEHYQGKDYHGLTESRKDFQLHAPAAANNEAGVLIKKGELFAEGTIGYSDQTDVIVPRLYGTYTVNDFQLLAGIYYSPYTGNNPMMDTADCQGMTGNGSLFDRSPQQIRLTYKYFYVMGMKPTAATYFAPYQRPGYAAYGEDDPHFRFPKAAIGYQAPMPFSYGIHFVGQTFKIDNVAGTGVDGERINSWAVAGKFGAFLPFGMINATAYFGQNINDMATLTDTKMAAQIDATDATKIADTKGYGASIGINYRTNVVTPAVGGGYEAFDNDNYSQKDKNAYLFASLTFRLANGVNIIPSYKLSYYGEGGRGEKEGKQMWYGILFEFMSVNY